MNKSEEINELAKSLSKVQGEVHNCFKDKSGYGYKYVDLAAILDAVRPLLSKNGLSVSQLCGSANDLATVETVLMHESGQWISSTIQMGVERGKGMSLAQAVGSVITYARRYSLAAMVGIAQTDDDASLKGQYHEEPVQQDPVTELIKMMDDNKVHDYVYDTWLNARNMRVADVTEDQALKMINKLKAMNYV